MFLFWLLVPPLCLVALSLPSSSFYTYILSPSSLLASTPSSTMAPLKVRARIATPMQSARAVLLLACVVASPGVFVLAPRHQKAIFHFSNPIPNSAQCSAVGKKQVKISVPYGAFVYVSVRDLLSFGPAGFVHRFLPCSMVALGSRLPSPRYDQCFATVCCGAG